ncbi:MAG: hypothetical protein J1F64_05495 [Oscillospiraceae bacterium]|nr:hypothetical protein [Oscillospiraceae bacterium]
MKKITGIIGILFGMTVIIPLAAVISIPVINNVIAHKTAEKIKDIELPDKTRYVELFSKAGKLTGNGNGMQYIGGILIKSELSQEDLQAYYSRYAEKEYECIVEKQTDKNIRFIEHGTVSFDTDIKGDDYYTVYSWGEGNFVLGLDLRAH